MDCLGWVRLTRTREAARAHARGGTRSASVGERSARVRAARGAMDTAARVQRLVWLVCVVAAVAYTHPVYTVCWAAVLRLVGQAACAALRHVTCMCAVAAMRVRRVTLLNLPLAVSLYNHTRERWRECMRVAAGGVGWWGGWAWWVLVRADVDGMYPVAVACSDLVGVIASRVVRIASCAALLVYASAWAVCITAVVEGTCAWAWFARCVGGGGTSMVRTAVARVVWGMRWAAWRRGRKWEPTARAGGDNVQPDIGAILREMCGDIDGWAARERPAQARPAECNDTGLRIVTHNKPGLHVQRRSRVGAVVDEGWGDGWCMLARPNDNLAAYMRMVAAGKADLVVASETRTQQEEMGVVRGLWQKMGYDHVGTSGKVGDAGSTVWGVSVVWNVQRLRLVSSSVVVPARVVRAEFEIVGDVDKQRMIVYGVYMPVRSGGDEVGTRRVWEALMQAAASDAGNAWVIGDVNAETRRYLARRSKRGDVTMHVADVQL